MRLERIFTHRAVRFLRITVPFLIVALVAIPAWNYYTRRAQKNSSTKPGVKLPSGVSVRTEGYTYSRTQGGRTQFVVHAKQSLGYKDDKYILQDVDAIIYGRTEQDPPRTIRGKNCTYDEASNDFTCKGNVEVQLDENTIVRTEHLIYKHGDGTIIAPEHASIERSGTTGQANSFEYEINSGLLKLKGDVNIHTADNVDLKTGAVLFQQKENWTTMSGGVFIQSPSGWIRGTTGRADLEPGTHKPKVITIQENVTAESVSQSRHESLKARAGWMEATMSPTGTAERIKARENVEFDKIAGDTHQRLTSGEADTNLRDGRVDTLEARQNARMVMGSDQALESPQIWTDGTGNIKTAGDSRLRVGDSIIEGKDFVIENAEDVVTFNTQRRATLKKEGGQESWSDQTRARFDGHTNMLLELLQTGNFQFRTPQYNGHAQTGRFEEGGTVITLDGSPIVNDSEKRLEAAQIRINQKDNSFVATRNVSTVILNQASSGTGRSARPGEPERVVVKATHAEGNADSMFYTGNVRLWRGEAYIAAERLKALGQGQQNAKIHAEGVPGKKVESRLQNIRATSDTLDYDDAAGLIRYLGGVRAQKQDMILETPDMTVHSRDGTVTEIVASGGVMVKRVDGSGSGEKAVYDAATDLVTFTGNPAQVRDKEHGSVQGSTFTMNNKGETVSVTAGNGGRTITKHPVNNGRK
jgi:LPS export ABC transporter protein LptC/lipopolysaccharide transport protein LptA